MPRSLPLFAPEVLQESVRDSGTASLKALCDAFGIRVGQEQLNEALNTRDTLISSDTLEETGAQLGLQMEQQVVPPDFLLLKEANLLPAIVALRQPNRRARFIIVWAQQGPLVQVMDPAKGRRWMRADQLLDHLYLHTLPVSASAWQEWATSAAFQAPLQQRLLALHLTEPQVTALLERATASGDWYSFASLEAASRLVVASVQQRLVQKGDEANQVLETLYSAAEQAGTPTRSPVPLPYWSVLPTEENEGLLLRGAVVLPVWGPRDDAPATEGNEAEEEIPPELLAAMEQQAAQTQQKLWRSLMADGPLAPGLLLIALAVAAGSVTLEALLLQGVMQLQARLGLFEQQVGALVGLLLFFCALILLDFSSASTSLRLGRRLEARLRISFLAKIPHLADHYFHRRPISDLTQRAYSLRNIRSLPDVGTDLLSTTFQFLITAVAVVWLNPRSLLIIGVAILLTAGLAWLSNQLISKAGLRYRLAANDLSRYYLDALLGLTPLRSHGAERALRREHEGKLVEWLEAGGGYYRLTNFLKGLASCLYAGVTIWILFDYIQGGGEASTLLLLTYWTLNLPTLLNSMAVTAIRYPYLYTIALMLFQSLDDGEAEETSEGDIPASATPTPESPALGVLITMQDVSVVAGGQTLLTDVNLTIRAGEHIGIVGSSGAGKSTLISLLLGWHEAATGEIQVDGEPLDKPRLQGLRRETAWIDPSIQIWNRTLLENLYYGNPQDDAKALGRAIEEADLFTVLEKLPDGLQTVLGESGGLVSGGEGQRVRLGRALLRPGIRLVILDEAFRGLDRDKRRLLLARVRQHWKDATLICITHDVGETQAFERTLVVEGGRIIEDGAPAMLYAQPGSRYRALVEAEDAVREGMWSGINWRRLWLANGTLTERKEIPPL